MKIFREPLHARLCSTILVAALILQPLASFGATITPALAQVPIKGLNPVKPNIMLTMDDSGSMLWDFLPDFVAYVASNVYHCRDSKQCGGATGTPNASYQFSQYDPPIRSADYNEAFYDRTIAYTPGKKADGTNLPCQGSDTTCASPWTSVYSNGYNGYPGSNGSATINLTTGYPDTIWCWKTNPDSTERATADLPGGNGSVCRRNGVAYSLVTTGGNTTPAMTAGYNYPNNSATCSGLQKCKFTNPVNVNGAPYYYTISQVQYCQNKDANGWGTNTPACVSQWDPTTYKYVRYGTGAATFDPQAFTRVDIKSTGILVNGVSATNPSGRTYAQEMQNFAIWYSFYRTRIQMMQGATGIAFSALDQNSRVGFHTLHESNLFTNIVDFTTANKNTWFTKLYSVAATGGTNLPDGVWRIGELFSGNLAASTLPGATDPLDPVTGKCQPNFHLLSTDGYWNSTLAYTSRGNNDRTVPSLPNLPGATGFTVGSNFPRPYYEGSTATSDSVADLAMYYWIRDIRPGLADKVKDAVAPWQHVTMYGLSIGARGTVSYPSGIDAITSGSSNWLPATGAGGPEAVDDLWHGAINTRGKFFNASNPWNLAESIVSALADFTDQAGTGAGVGMSGAQLSVSNQHVYKTSYEAGLWGDVKKYAINITTGVLPVNADGVPLAAPVWSAATQLDTQAAGVGWDTRRRIVTINTTTNAAVPFRLAELSTSQQASLNAGWSSVPSPPTAQKVLDYLRGDKSNEGVGTTNFRTRTHILGDIVASAAVPVGAPSEPYGDTGTALSPNPGYNAFKSAKAGRAGAVYVGANDGMLHAFDDTVANGGKETWAYVPAALFSNGDPNDSAHAASPAYQLGALSYRRGGIPMHAHKFYVNATPRVADVDFANTNTSTPPSTGNDWRTILVGGLGAGGRAVYALDVTNPVAAPSAVVSAAEAATADTTAATKVLWEYTEANLGYVYDAPTLAKTYAYGWVVLVASGYNNPGGKGFLYVLNPNSPLKSGQLLKKIALPGDTGTDLSPTGLGTIRGYTASHQNPYVLQAYGGDLKGNVWRFDLSNRDPNLWSAAKIAALKDASNVAQPITSGIQIEIDQNNHVDRYLFVGTGKLLEQADLTDTSMTNTLYVIKDGNRTTPEPAPATPYSRSNLNQVNGSSVSGFSGAPTGRGWYQDGTNVNQKVNRDVVADMNFVAYGFSEPGSDPCLSVLSSTLFAREFGTGKSVLLSGGSVVPSVSFTAGIAGLAILQSDPGTASAMPNALIQVTGENGIDAIETVDDPLAGARKRRFSWSVISP